MRTLSKKLRTPILLLCVVALALPFHAFASDVVIRWQSRDRDPVGGIDINEVIVQAFEAAHPGIRVDFTATSGSELPVQLVGGAAPDVVDATGPAIRDLFGNGLLLPLDAYLDRILPGGDRGDFFEPQLEALQQSGVLYAVPKYLGTVGLWYNTQLFDHAGLPYPDEHFDWNRLVEYGRRLVQTDGSGRHTQIAFHKSDGLNRVAPWIRQNGGRYYVDGDPTRSALDEPAAIDALQFLADLRFQHEVWSNQSSSGAWGEGRVAMIEEGMWRMLSYAEELPFEFRLAEPPKGPHGPATHATTDAYAIAWHTNHPEEAAIFLKFLISPEANRIRLQYYGRQPARMSVIREMPEILYAANPRTASLDFGVYAAAGMYAIPQPFYSDQGIMNDLLTPALRRILRDNESAATVMRSVIPTLNAQLRGE